MGGTVAVTLRKPDGTDYRMDRWTNSMPWGIGNRKMITHDIAHVDNYLKEWLGMKEDYEQNKETGVYEYPMTDCYFPSEGLAPCGYGLVVVDMVNNVILTMQSYTSFDSLCAASISMDLPHGINDPDSNVSIFKEFFDAGKVAGVMTRDSFKIADAGGDPYLPLTQSFDDLMAELVDPNKRNLFDFKLDLSPFTLEEFEESDPKELIRMRTRILELGFTLTDAENEVWDDTIKEYEEEYGDCYA